MSSSTSLSNQEKEIAKRYAPIVYLHPRDMNRPSSVEHYLTTVNLIVGEGNATKEMTNVTPEILTQYPDKDNYMKFKKDPPTGNNDYETGDLSNIQGNNCNSPGYVHFDYDYNDGTYRIVYALFYPFNGYQMFRTSITTHRLSSKKRNFPLPRFGRHEGDWEHISLKMNKQTNTPIEIIISQHGGHEKKNVGDKKISYEDHTHSKIYSAINSHAHYFEKATITLDKVYELAFGCLQWVNVADCTTTDAVVTYNKKNANDYIKWDLQKNLVFMDDDENVSKWIQYQGRFGRPDLDNSHIDKPPKLPENGANDAFNLAKTAKFLGKIPDKYKNGGGPRGPQSQIVAWYKKGDDQN
jgi:hypothetical protein